MNEIAKRLVNALVLGTIGAILCAIVPGTLKFLVSITTGGSLPSDDGSLWYLIVVVMMAVVGVVVARLLTRALGYSDGAARTSSIAWLVLFGTIALWGMNTAPVGFMPFVLLWVGYGLVIGLLGTYRSAVERGSYHSS
jgi:hypothetical protein